jgi:hypothetical protein
MYMQNLCLRKESVPPPPPLPDTPPAFRLGAGGLAVPVALNMYKKIGNTIELPRITSNKFISRSDNSVLRYIDSSLPVGSWRPAEIYSYIGRRRLVLGHRSLF